MLTEFGPWLINTIASISLLGIHGPSTCHSRSCLCHSSGEAKDLSTARSEMTWHVAEVQLMPLIRFSLFNPLDCQSEKREREVLDQNYYETSGIMSINFCMRQFFIETPFEPKQCRQMQNFRWRVPLCGVLLSVSKGQRFFLAFVASCHHEV